MDFLYKGVTIIAVSSFLIVLPCRAPSLNNPLGECLITEKDENGRDLVAVEGGTRWCCGCPPNKKYLEACRIGNYSSTICIDCEAGTEIKEVAHQKQVCDPIPNYRAPTTTSPADIAEQQNGIQWYVWVIVGLLVLVAILVACLCWSRIKKKCRKTRKGKKDEQNDQDIKSVNSQKKEDGQEKEDGQSPGHHGSVDKVGKTVNKDQSQNVNPTESDETSVGHNENHTGAAKHPTEKEKPGNYAKESPLRVLTDRKKIPPDSTAVKWLSTDEGPSIKHPVSSDSDFSQDTESPCASGSNLHSKSSPVPACKKNNLDSGKENGRARVYDQSGSVKEKLTHKFIWQQMAEPLCNKSASFSGWQNRPTNLGLQEEQRLLKEGRPPERSVSPASDVNEFDNEDERTSLLKKEKRKKNGKMDDVYNFFSNFPNIQECKNIDIVKKDVDDLGKAFGVCARELSVWVKDDEAPRSAMNRLLCKIHKREGDKLTFNEVVTTFRAVGLALLADRLLDYVQEKHSS